MRKAILACNLCLVLLTVSCSRYPADVERALRLSGENRVELEKVLKHYSKRPDDKLKLRSACFLIANMPYHYTLHDDRLEAFKEYLIENEPNERLLNEYKEKHGSINGKRTIIYDLHHITAAFLIWNIDFSFQIWQESPWGRTVSFDDFCEDILPYRISNEPLECWKEKYHAVFRPVIDTMTQKHQLETVIMQLIRYIQDQGWLYEYYISSQGFGASTLLNYRYGGCKEMAEYITYAFRSVGIPSGIDQVIQNPDDFMNRGHFWNYTRNSAGKHFGFDYYENDYVFLADRSSMRKYGKIYQHTFALQNESLPVKFKNSYIPPGGLRNFLLRDVTSEYFSDTHISVQLESHHIFGRKDIACLCVFNGKEWIPIAWSKPKSSKAVFRYVEPGILYQVRLINQTANVAVSKPFILLENEKALFVDADTTRLQTMTLLRKHKAPLPSRWWHYFNRAVGGKFQGANHPDFSDAVTLHTIQQAADMNYVDVQPEHSGTFKYVRYLSAPDGYNNMAEVQFFSGGNRLRGEVTGTDGSREVFPNSTRQAVFDDDPLTFFDAIDADGSWAGLQFDRAYQIDAIRYIFRNDDNNIRPGDTYELFYQSAGQWVSAGRQTADTALLLYENVPSNTLYWLRNHTRGIEERPFTYEDGKQVWW